MKRITLILVCILSLPNLIPSQKSSVRCEDGGSGSGPVSEELKKLDRGARVGKGL